MSYYSNPRQESRKQVATAFASGGRKEMAVPTQCCDLKAGGHVFLQGYNCEIIAIQPSEFNDSMVRIVRCDAETGEPMNDQYVNIGETVYVPCEEAYSSTSSDRNQRFREDARGPSSQMVARNYQSSNAGRYRK
ncbi:hypothetical protein BDV27DRAFT_163034 [Aspergillus caelatus]|uniref:Translation protein SH3-like domain-containing protein n=2 Tax=Aspergillus subgen. Circumdati TaxID=2720871 RepID=A0A5N6ZN21_9EURO|nr:uncharacterized protein BDV27DRAFT_163034 [Aspergillus caelatus]KAE8359021.1 hypothetical protein BDV27DRAFT_163034 [Aspergillus caelatus]KAE8416281.1 hypothetical protein BDV36DRAFT_297253 [Aspergillus pseudocaelatus]